MQHIGRRVTTIPIASQTHLRDIATNEGILSIDSIVQALIRALLLDAQLNLPVKQVERHRLGISEGDGISHTNGLHLMVGTEGHSLLIAR